VSRIGEIALFRYGFRGSRGLGVCVGKAGAHFVFPRVRGATKCAPRSPFLVRE